MRTPRTFLLWSRAFCRRTDHGLYGTEQARRSHIIHRLTLNHGTITCRRIPRMQCTYHSTTRKNDGILFSPFLWRHSALPKHEASLLASSVEAQHTHKTRSIALSFASSASGPSWLCARQRLSNAILYHCNTGAHRTDARRSEIAATAFLRNQPTQACIPTCLCPYSRASCIMYAHTLDISYSPAAILP